MKIGIIGLGYVGSAVAWSYKHKDLVIRDPKLKDSAELSEFLDCDAIFVCVPSPCVDPTLEDGRCNSSILEQTLKELLFVVINKQIPIICKTTAPPSVYTKLWEEYPNIVHAPEFLTAASHITDYMDAEFAVLGGGLEWCHKARSIIREGVEIPVSNFIIVDPATAALYKYMSNSYFATKVTFMNEFAELAAAEGVEWSDITTIASYDSRIGPTHMNVPGHNGEYGWGGACFPKDVAAIITEAMDKGLDFELMQRVETLNKKHRTL